MSLFQKNHYAAQAWPTKCKQLESLSLPLRIQQGFEGDPEGTFSPLPYTKQLLLLTFCTTLQEIGLLFGHTERNKRKEWTD